MTNLPVGINPVSADALKRAEKVTLEATLEGGAKVLITKDSRLEAELEAFKMHLEGRTVVDLRVKIL